MDIAVSAAVEAPESFNAIGSCIKKEYIYKLFNSPIRDPFLTVYYIQKTPEFPASDKVSFG